MGDTMLSVQRLVTFISVVFGIVVIYGPTGIAANVAEPKALTRIEDSVQKMKDKAGEMETELKGYQKQLADARKRLVEMKEELVKKQEQSKLGCPCADKCCKVHLVARELEDLKGTTEEIRTWVESQKNESSEVLDRQSYLNQSMMILKDQLDEAMYGKMKAADSSEKQYSSCKRMKPRVTGVAKIWLKTTPVDVYCDDEWTVIQRRQNGQLNFDRGWDDYVNGFGDVNDEYWIGLDTLYKMSAKTQWDLQVDLETFDNQFATALYTGFSVASSAKMYALKLRKFVSGTAGDSLASGHNSMRFSTKDKDNDNWRTGNCAAVGKGGWWFNACMKSNLNGKYYTGKKFSLKDGTLWSTWTKSKPLKSTVMKIRPTD